MQYYEGVPVFASIVSSSEVRGQQEQWTGSLMTKIAADLPKVKPNFTAAVVMDAWYSSLWQKMAALIT